MLSFIMLNIDMYACVNVISGQVRATDIFYSEGISLHHWKDEFSALTLLHIEWPKLYWVLVILRAVGLKT